MNGKLLHKYKGDFVGLLGVDLPPLVPAKLWTVIDGSRDEPSQASLKRYLSRHHNTTLHTEFDSTFSVSGEFDADEERMHIYVRRPKFFTDKEWAAYKAEIIVTLMHEYVHFMQYLHSGDSFDFVLLHKEHRNPKKEEDREYYSAWGEIQAYAHCILMEMKDRNPNKPAAEMLMSKRKGYYSPTLIQVRRNFEGFDYPLRWLYREVLRWEKRYENNAEALNIRN